MKIEDRNECLSNNAKCHLDIPVNQLSTEVRIQLEFDVGVRKTTAIFFPDVGLIHCSVLT